MTRKTFHSLFRLSVLMIFVFVFLQNAFPQSENDDEISLRDISEAILVNGRPALKILSPKKGGYTEVKLQKRGGEDALVFDVVKMSVKNPVGKLFITKTKVIFDALGKKESSFSIEKAVIKKCAVKKSADGFPSLELDTDNDEAKFAVKFDRFRHLIDRASQRAVHDLLYRAINDFDLTIKEFNELTKGAFPGEN